MLVTGLIAGAASVYFLKSDKGQQMIDLVLTKTDDLKSTIVDTSNDILNDGKSQIENVFENSKSILNDAKDTVLTASENVQDKLDMTISDFQKGVEKAKNEIQNV